MSPEQFLARLAKQPLAPAYLFLGQEGYQRRLCKEALLARALPPETRLEGFTHFDLEEISLSEVLDDARSLSLFAPERLIWVGSAELALPRRATSTDDADGAGDGSSESQLTAYLKGPTPGTVLVFDCSRFDFSGDDRTKLERVEKLYSAVPLMVEFRQFTPESIRFLAQELAKEHRLRLAAAELAALTEAVGGDANRLAAEIEKLSLFLGPERTVTLEDLAALVPNAAQSTIFTLVNALARRERAGALKSLDILIREREYLPLALTFLSGHFRLALVAKEARISSAQQAQTYFQKIGVRMWRDRAEQVVATARTFDPAHLRRAVGLIYETDKKFREGYRDDRIVMESLVLALTSDARHSPL